MIHRLVAVAALGAVAVAVPAFAADRHWQPGTLIGTVPEAVTETSGLTDGKLDDGILWTHNDSSAVPFDPSNAEVFAMTHTGELVATVSLNGVGVTDVEDIAWGPGQDPDTPSLYLADIGDNFLVRPNVIVYVFPELVIDAQARGLQLRSTPSSTYTLTYPGLRHDAETLLVHPVTGELTIVTKTTTGISKLFTAPRPSTPVASAVLTEVGEIDFGAIFVRDSYNDAFPDNELQATGGEISPDGSRVVVRTYTEAHDWALGEDGDVAAAVLAAPVNVPIPDESQGEAIAWRRDGLALFTSSENTRTLHRMELAVTDPPAPGDATPAPEAKPTSAQLPATGGSTMATVAALLAIGAATVTRRRSDTTVRWQP